MRYDVFICHAKPDDTHADEIASALVKAGLTCWVDHQRAQDYAGEQFTEEIVDVIDQVTAFVVIITSNSNYNENVKKEIRLAHERPDAGSMPGGQGRRARKLFFIRIGEFELSKALAYETSGTQCVLAPSGLDAKSLQALVARICEHVSSLKQSAAGTLSKNTPDAVAQVRRDIRIALADGVLSDREIEFIIASAAELGVDEATSRRLIDEERDAGSSTTDRLKPSNVASAPKSPSAGPTEDENATTPAQTPISLVVTPTVAPPALSVETVPDLSEDLNLALTALNRDGLDEHLKQRAPERLTSWRRAAEADDHAGMWLYGWCLLNGLGCEANPAAGLRLVRHAAEAGFAAAQWALGQCYERELGGLEQEPQVAFRWYKRAADQGLAEAIRQVAECTRIGFGTSADMRVAFALFEQAVASGSTLALYNLGHAFEHGEGTRAAPKKAFAFYMKAAEAGHTSVLSEVGRCHAEGIGTPVNLQDAAASYRRGADVGDAVAMRLLGRAYELGDGVEQSDAKAVEWYRMAAEAGDAEAQYELGSAYANDGWLGLTEDKEQAIRWLQLAATQEHEEAVRLLRKLQPKNATTKIKHGRPGPDRYLADAERGDPEAQFKVGQCYLYAWQVPQNEPAALKWFAKAAASGHAEACYMLGRIAWENRPLGPDTIVASDWLKKAASAKHSKARELLKTVEPFAICLRGDKPIDRCQDEVLAKLGWLFEKQFKKELNERYAVPLGQLAASLAEYMHFISNCNIVRDEETDADQGDGPDTGGDGDDEPEETPELCVRGRSSSEAVVSLYLRVYHPWLELRRRAQLPELTCELYLLKRTVRCILGMDGNWGGEYLLDLCHRVREGLGGCFPSAHYLDDWFETYAQEDPVAVVLKRMGVALDAFWIDWLERGELPLASIIETSIAGLTWTQAIERFRQWVFQFLDALIPALTASAGTRLPEPQTPSTPRALDWVLRTPVRPEALPLIERTWTDLDPAGVRLLSLQLKHALSYHLHDDAGILAVPVASPLLCEGIAAVRVPFHKAQYGRGVRGDAYYQVQFDLLFLFGPARSQCCVLGEYTTASRKDLDPRTTCVDTFRRSYSSQFPNAEFIKPNDAKDVLKEIPSGHLANQLQSQDMHLIARLWSVDSHQQRWDIDATKFVERVIDTLDKLPVEQVRRASRGDLHYALFENDGLSR